MQKPVLTILAAGMGSRYGGGIKQMDPVDAEGCFIIDYSVYDAMRAGFEEVIFIIKEAIAHDFEATIGARVAPHMQVRYAYQELSKLPSGIAVPEGRVKPLGTTHALLCAEEAIAGRPFAVINADDYYGPEAFKVMFDRLSQVEDDDKYEYAMVGFLLKNTVSENGHVSRGVCESDAAGYLTRVTERTRIETYEGGIHYSEDGGESWTDLDGGTLVSMNLWGFTESFLREDTARFAAFLDKALAENPMKGEYFLPSVVSQLVDEGKARVKVLTSHDKWYGVTYQEDKPLVVKALAEKTAQGQYPDGLWG